MNRFHRIYAHSAWTPADPLAGLDPNERRAILLMPSTFFERLRMFPWRTYDKKREAMLDIIAERRLVYDLMQHRMHAAPPPMPPLLPQDHSHPYLPASGQLSPYYADRLARHHQAIAEMTAQRQAEDREALLHNPAARADREMRDARRKAMLELHIERARLDIKELDIHAGLYDRPPPQEYADGQHPEPDAPRPTRSRKR